MDNINELKEELFSIRENLVTTLHLAKGTDEFEEVMRFIQEIPHRIDDLNRIDFQNNINTLEELHSEANLRNKKIQDSLNDLSETSNKISIVREVLKNTKEVISFITSMI